MLRIVGISIVVFAAGWLACALPVSEKTGCVTSADCVDARVCVDGQCTPGACGLTCLAACDRVEDCGTPVAECEEECIEDDGLLPGFTDAQCKRQWDILAADDDCDAPTCLGSCRDLCVCAADCRLIVDAAACTLACQEAEDGCLPATPCSCADVPAVVQCYESGRC